jgi:hypothetical protein
MTTTELKYNVEQNQNESFFFTRETMKFFGDTMRNYGVRKAVVDTHTTEGVEVYELYRRRPVKYNNQDSAYFDRVTFDRVFAKRD